MKVSLVSQIAEVQTEIQKRGEVYGRLVSKGQMRASEADYKIGIMKSVAQTLIWLQRHEETVRKAVAEKEGDA
jgi:hypothetical protein